MKDVLRRSIKAFLQAEGRLEMETLGPGKKHAPRSSRGAAAVLKEGLRQARLFQVRNQRICTTLLVLVSTVQVILVVYGLGTNNLLVVFASGIGLLPLPISWVLRRIGWERFLTDLIGSFLGILPSREAGRIIEIVYRVYFGEPLTIEDEERIPILFVSSHPSDMAQLRLGREAREIQKELRAAKLRHRFVLHQWSAATPEDLLQAMLDTQPEIVQFSGHGLDDGALCFEDALGGSQPVEPAALAALFGEFRDVQCVLLNACYAARQKAAIAEHIEYVIGAPDIIEDGAAIAFAVGFYKSLGAGCSIEEAYRLGCVELELRGFPREAAPILARRNRPE
jgi:hypothetical protein